MNPFVFGRSLPPGELIDREEELSGLVSLASQLIGRARELR
jgi:hypothetical protein